MSAERIQERVLTGFALQQQGRLDEAAAAYREALAEAPDHFDARHLLGVIDAARGDFASAVTNIGRALTITADNAGAHYNMGYALEGLGRTAEAIGHYDRAIALRPDYIAAHASRGGALYALRQYPAARASFDQVLALDPQDANAALARALIRRALKDLTGALADCDRAIAARPDDAGAHITRGTILADLRHQQGALASYDVALRLRPDSAEAHTNRGLALAALGEDDAALASFDAAIRCNPALAAAHYHKGVYLSVRGAYEASLACLARAAALDPHQEFLFGQHVLAKMRLCDWSTFTQDVGEMAARINRGEHAAPAFVALALTDSPPLHRRAAEIQTTAECPPDPTLGPITPRAAAAKIKLGYFSMDFRTHPVAQLIAGLFEGHDRNRFEVHVFSYGPDADDDLRRRIVAGCDHFHDVRLKSNREVASFARHLGIDIAIDLAGHTADARSGIFALRAAPVQVNYIGYPATMGAAYIDYIVADRVALPDDSDICEKIARLPWFQVNDRKRVISSRTFTRAELGLPPAGFVFCCFNNSYKITPQMFDVWMRILARVPGSVLWLTTDNAVAATNLRREAAGRGIDPARLVFADRAAPPDYLARLPLADLFLDTLPYNAGTTASDALWMGLPVLTCPGKSYTARMAASLLHAAGLTDLIAATPEAYEDLAVALAGDPQRLASLRAQLARRDCALFDAAAFARHLEAAYQVMMARHAAGQPPDHINISPAPDHGDLQRRAVAAYQNGAFREAADLFARAVEARPDAAASHNNLGVALTALGRLAEARACFVRALQLKPDYVDAHYNLGNAERDLGATPAARAAYDAVLALDPTFADALNARGDLLRSLGEIEAAMHDLDRAIAVKPDGAIYHNNRAAALRQAGKTSEAEAGFERAIALDPTLADAHYNLGNILQDRRDFTGALARYDQALALRPAHAAALNNRGNVLRALKRHVDAIESYTRAIAAAPDGVDAYINRGAAAADLGRAADALADHDRAVQLAPASADAHNSRGIALRELGRHGEAEAAHRRAIDLAPDHAEAHWALSICLLQQGDFARGWPLYEWRWKVASLKLEPRSFAAPLWQGEDLRGKTILLHGEQGLGDAIQFSRYVPLVAERGARVLLEVAAPLVPLLKTVPGVKQIIAKGEALPPFDLHCPLLSLPLAFATTPTHVPPPTPIVIPPEKMAAWGERLGPRRRPRIGISWSGNARHTTDLQRSIALEDFAALLPPGADYISLQKDERPEDVAFLLSTHLAIRRFAGALHDFTDTAALCAQMDLIISVDTSVAHLAGTLGKPVWILVAASADWRWLLERRDSPWYPTALLYRQPAAGDWKSVFTAVRANLTEALARLA